jgi:hypothetical protein
VFVPGFALPDGSGPDPARTPAWVQELIAECARSRTARTTTRSTRSRRRCCGCAAGGKLTSIEQQAFKDGDWGMFEIPADRLMLLTHKKRGDEFTGRSMLRAAHKAWKLKEIFERTEVAASQRHGVGVNVGYLPRSLANDEKALERLEDMLRDLRAGDLSYLAFPGPKQTSGQGGDDGYLFEIATPAGGLPDFSKPKEYQRAEIKAAVLARFAELGHAAVGARATGDVQAVVWYAALHAVARYIADVHDEWTRKVIDANLKVTRYPKLNASGIEVRNLAEFAEAVSRVVMSGAVNPDEPFRAWVREGMSAPAETEVPPDPSDAANVDGKGNPIEPENQPGDKPAPKPDPKKEP